MLEGKRLDVLEYLLLVFGDDYGNQYDARYTV
jgi:hypothetical protein